jgi:glycosyltransferase involved in cell wall biosynthesis
MTPRVAWRGRTRRAGIAVTTMVLPAYHQHLLEVLAEWDADIAFHHGDVYFTTGVDTEIDSPLSAPTGTNRFFLGRRLAWQSGAVRVAVPAPVAIVDVNPRVLSAWCIILVRAVLRRPTVGWGHANPRHGPTGPTMLLRRVMQAACSGLVMYTRSEAAEMRRIFPRKHIVVATNSLYPERLMWPAGDRRGTDIVAIGRLVAEKKPLLAIDALAAAQDALPPDCTLHVVGEGPPADDLARAAREKGLESRVVLHGKVFDVAELSAIFARSAVLLATGYVGLNVIQALGFGTPVVYPDDEPHAPELEALHEGNSLAFTAGDAESCGRALVAALGRARDGGWSPETIAEEARRAYSNEAMARALLDAGERRRR